jgi:hypothetical protein
MSEHDQFAEVSDNKTPGKLGPRLAQWEQPRPTDKQREPSPRPTPGKLGARLAEWEKRKGYDRISRKFVQEVLGTELPHPPEVKAAIQEQLVDPSPPRIPPRVSKPKLERTSKQRDLSSIAKDVWAGLYDDTISKWDALVENVKDVKSKRRSELGGGGLNALLKNAQAVIDAGEYFLGMAPEEKPSTSGREGLVKDTRRPELAKLQDEIKPIVAEAKRLQKAIGDMADDRYPDDLGRALELTRRGVRSSDLKLDEYGDDKLDRNSSKEDFAGGAVNKVSKLVYGDETRIFKPEGLTTDSKANLINNLGIDRSAPRFGNRNVATKVMSSVLGGCVIPDACYTVHDGKVGLLMEMAPGQEVKDFKKAGFNPKPPSEDVVASLHGQLNELEWTDMLTGQGDRHDGNYMIDAGADSIKITGIDNDFCFGEKQTDYKKYGTSPDVGPKLHKVVRMHGAYKSAELPQLIDKKTYDNLVGKDFDKDVKPGLVGLLTDEEIAAGARQIP